MATSSFDKKFEITREQAEDLGIIEEYLVLTEEDSKAFCGAMEREFKVHDNFIKAAQKHKKMVTEVTQSGVEKVGSGVTLSDYEKGLIKMYLPEMMQFCSTPEVMGPDSRCTPDWFVGLAIVLGALDDD